MRTFKALCSFYDREVCGIATPPLPEKYRRAERRRFEFFSSDAGGAIAAVFVGIAVILTVVFYKPNPSLMDSASYMFRDENFQSEIRANIQDIIQSIEIKGGEQ